MCIVTYIPRVVPIAIFRRKMKSKFLKSFLYYVPFSVLGAMTFPSIFFATSNVYAALAGTIAAVVLAYFEKGLMTVATSSVAVVYLVLIILK
jgi:branched-subunit amino acid transport protein